MHRLGGGGLLVFSGRFKEFHRGFMGSRRCKGTLERFKVSQRDLSGFQRRFRGSKGMLQDFNF